MRFLHNIKYMITFPEPCCDVKYRIDSHIWSGNIEYFWGIFPSISYWSNASSRLNIHISVQIIMHKGNTDLVFIHMWSKQIQILKLIFSSYHSFKFSFRNLSVLLDLKLKNSLLYSIWGRYSGFLSSRWIGGNHRTLYTFSTAAHSWSEQGFKGMSRL